MSASVEIGINPALVTHRERGFGLPLELDFEADSVT